MDSVVFHSTIHTKRCQRSKKKLLSLFAFAWCEWTTRVKILLFCHTNFMKHVHWQGSKIFLNFLLDQGPFCEATDSPYFVLRVTLPMGFKARVVLSPAHSTCLCAVNLRVMSGATPAFSTNRGVHCIRVYTAGPPSRHPSCKQQMAGNGGCSGEIRSCCQCNRQTYSPTRHYTHGYRFATKIVANLYPIIRNHSEFTPRYIFVCTLKYTHGYRFAMIGYILANV